MGNIRVYWLYLAAVFLTTSAVLVFAHRRSPKPNLQNFEACVLRHIRSAGRDQYAIMQVQRSCAGQFQVEITAASAPFFEGAKFTTKGDLTFLNNTDFAILTVCVTVRNKLDGSNRHECSNKLRQPYFLELGSHQNESFQFQLSADADPGFWRTHIWSIDYVAGL